MVLISDGHGGDEDPRLRDPALGLSAFRSRLYGCLGRRADALFELTDAILTTNTNPSLVHLSLASVHRRGWGSLYAALSKGRIGAGVLRNLLARLRLADDPGRARVYAVDRSSWPRCDAECSPDRGYYYHPSRHSAGQPIVAGWAYQLVAELGFERDSWVNPADIRRVKPEEDANLVAIEQAGVCSMGCPSRALEVVSKPAKQSLFKANRLPRHAEPRMRYDAFCGGDPGPKARTLGDSCMTADIRREEREI